MRRKNVRKYKCFICGVKNEVWKTKESNQWISRDISGHEVWLNTKSLSELPSLPPSWTALFDDPKQIFCGHHKVTIATEKTGILDQEFFPVIGLPK